eukprot:scaffold48573_cov30-Cyclotella_meneghiniana.AAC.3
MAMMYSHRSYLRKSSNGTTPITANWMLDPSKKAGVTVILMADILNHEMMQEHKKAVAAVSTPPDTNTLDPESVPTATAAPTAPKLITNDELAKTNEVFSVASMCRKNKWLSQEDYASQE